MNSFWKSATECPPPVVRMLAKANRGRVMTTQEIAARSGLDAPTVAWVASRHSWDEIPLGVMRKFLFGCRLDFEDARLMKRVRAYVRSNPKWIYLKRSPEWESVFVPLIRILNHA